MAADTYDIYDVLYTGQAAVILRRRQGMIMTTLFVLYLYVAGAQNPKSTLNAGSYVSGSAGAFNAFVPL